MTEPRNEYERKRQENILKNKLLLQQLQLDSAVQIATGSRSTSKPSKSTRTNSKRKRSKPKEEHTEPVILRKSSRLAGLPAESEIGRKKQEAEYVALRDEEKAKRARIAGDLTFDVKPGLIDVVKQGFYEKTFTNEDVKTTTDKDIKKLREKMMGLKLYEKFPLNDIKITLERVYCLSFHPTTDKQVIFAGDKAGNLGIWDASMSMPDPDNEEDEENELPSISNYKIHTQTIHSLTLDPAAAASLYTASYDGSIRKFDIAKGIATEVYVSTNNDGFSGIEFMDPHTICFSTLEGIVGRKDLRTNETDRWQLSEKKIGGIGLHPRATNLLATASLDRTVKIWDLRKISGKGIFGHGPDRTPTLLGQHTSSLSVSSAYWNSQGTLATTSYDDTVKLYKFPNATSWGIGQPIIPRPSKPRKKRTKLEDDVKSENIRADEGEDALIKEEELGEEGREGEEGEDENEFEFSPDVIIPHNNRSGKWVTILRAQWQQNPASGAQKFVIGNMKRYLDIYSSDGLQLAQLGHDDITAVPAVAMFHPTQDWVAGGTASGKVALFM